MGIKVRTEISDEYKKTEVIIISNKLTKEIQDVINMIQNLDTYLSKIIVSKDNDMFIFNIEEIICFYSEGKKNYCRTNNGTFKVKEALYQLEEKLPPNKFIRISNSCIINIEHVECFNTGIVGTIMVRFKDGNIEYVSRRRASKVMQQLKGGI